MPPSCREPDDAAADAAAMLAQQQRRSPTWNQLAPIMPPLIRSQRVTQLASSITACGRRWSRAVSRRRPSVCRPAQSECFRTSTSRRYYVEAGLETRLFQPRLSSPRSLITRIRMMALRTFARPAAQCGVIAGIRRTTTPAWAQPALPVGGPSLVRSSAASDDERYRVYGNADSHLELTGAAPQVSNGDLWIHLARWA